MDARMMPTIKAADRAAVTITDVKALDIRFPTSRKLDGSDAMNPDPDYSAAYVILSTDSEHEAHERRGSAVIQCWFECKDKFHAA